MNKNAIKKFAMAARTRLIATVSDRAGMLGITKDKISQPKSKGNGFEIYETAAGTENTLNRNQLHQRRRLVEQIEARGFDVVVEEIAYTWFNRICAIRFMEVNDYLPTRVRALSSLREGKNEPDLLTEAPNVDLDFTDQEREWILTAKEQNRLDELFSMLFIKQCNKLSEILPELFEATEDYTEMLLSLSYTNKDDVIRMLVDGVDEEDFNVSTPDEDGNPTGQVEIIGWLYQYYNTELKDDTFAQLKKNVKISKERIPAATQLFTPDWIVRYMVENSVGRIWIEHLRAVDPSTDEKETAERFGWNYYLPEAEQEPEVSVKLAEIRKSYESLKPEDIRCIDPCMGSGHIIVAQFDVLMDIYTSVGYGEREAAFEIVEHNLHGLDIDKRAYQLAYFAVMMKGRQYNRRFFQGKDDILPRPKVYAFSESNDINRAHLKYFGADLNELEKRNALNQITGLLDTFKDAREYGSILNVGNYDWALLRSFIQHDNVPDQLTLDAVGIDETKKDIAILIDLGEVMAKKYDAVVTNPPYMGSSGMSRKLSEHIKQCYENSKSDLYAVFIEKCHGLSRENAYYAMITQHSWMFLSSYEKLRERIYENPLINMIHLGTRAFDEISGEIVQTTSFVIRNGYIKGYNTLFSRLVDYNGEREKKQAFLDRNTLYESEIEKYKSIPNKVLAYWASDRILRVFSEALSMNQVAEPKRGMCTCANNLFYRCWFEIDYTQFCNPGLDYIDYNGWVPLNKGGETRKWYGNLFEVVDWKNNAARLRAFKNAQIKNEDYYFLPAITWSSLTSSTLSFRYTDKGYIFDQASNGVFPEKINKKYILGFLNSKVAALALNIINPSMNILVGDVAMLPIIVSVEKENEIVDLVNHLITLAKEEWDNYEISWNMKKHPLAIVSDENSTYIQKLYENWEIIARARIQKAVELEKKLNQYFIDIYGLQDESFAPIKEEDITLRKAELRKDIKSLISYAIGCMFGRYSTNLEGIAYAGGCWESSRYTSFIPDKDNIIPITDEEYFEDDIVGLFCGWLKKVYGENTLEGNLDFIAKALGNKGDTSRDVLRNYFLNDFFKDHCNTYSVNGSGKRPIYWLFDSGKQNGFKALIYLHRYNQDTVGRVRMDYLHKTQKAIEHAMQSAQYTLENSKSGTEKSKATRRIAKYTKQLAEIQLYDEAIAHVANQRIALDLDDGVKVNYAKFQGVEVAREGMKTVKVDLLAKI